MNLRGVASTILLAALAVALTLSTLVLAPLPLMLLRRNGGRSSFFVGSGLGAALLVWAAPPFVVIAFLAAVVLSLVFCEAESQNIGYSSSIFVALLVVLGFGAIGAGYAIQQYGFDPVEFFRTQVNLGLSQVTLPAGVTVDKEALIKQIPSALLIMIIFSVWISSILATRTELLLGWKPSAQKNVYAGKELRSWKLPDSFVWVALASLAGTFFEVQPVWAHWVATNVFNVVVMLYFFQGLAIIVDFFVVKRVSPLWRAIAYVFIFSQLFLMVAFIGFVDLWVGFRDKTKSDKSAVA
jgi:hypothetical protein